MSYSYLLKNYYVNWVMNYLSIPQLAVYAKLIVSQLSVHTKTITSCMMSILISSLNFTREKPDAGNKSFKWDLEILGCFLSGQNVAQLFSVICFRRVTPGPTWRRR